MILGQLRIGARQAKNAALLTNQVFHEPASQSFVWPWRNPILLEYEITCLSSFKAYMMNMLLNIDIFIQSQFNLH